LLIIILFVYCQFITINKEYNRTECWSKKIFGDESAGTGNWHDEMVHNTYFMEGEIGLPIIMLLLGMVSTIVIVAFALQNGRIVNVSFFDWSIEASLVLVIMVSALMGFITALFFELFVQLKLRYKLFKQGRQLKQLEEEVLVLQKQYASKSPGVVGPTGDGAQSANEAPIIKE
jgi:uncharacterized integral membrane protein